MLQISHDARAGRLSAELEGYTGQLDYELDGTVMSITRTSVPPAIGGRGVAAELTRRALELAAANGWTVRPYAHTPPPICKGTRRGPRTRTPKHSSTKPWRNPFRPVTRPPWGTLTDPPRRARV